MMCQVHQGTNPFIKDFQLPKPFMIIQLDHELSHLLNTHKNHTGKNSPVAHRFLTHFESYQ